MATKTAPMKRYSSILAAGILALLVVLHFLSVQALSQSDIQSQSIVPALNYLARNYNSTVGLLHESPDSANISNTYWLYSDNFLASLAFNAWSFNMDWSLVPWFSIS